MYDAIKLKGGTATFGTIDITIPKESAEHFSDIKSAKDIYHVVKEFPEMKKYMLYKEVFYAIYINSAGSIIALHKVAEGGSDRQKVHSARRDIVERQHAYSLSQPSFREVRTVYSGQKHDGRSEERPRAFRCQVLRPHNNNQRRVLFVC